MIYVVWTIYFLLYLILAILCGLLGGMAGALIDIIRERRKDIVRKREWQRISEEYDCKEIKRRLHEIEKEEWPLFFWKEGTKDGNS